MPGLVWGPAVQHLDQIYTMTAPLDGQAHLCEENATVYVYEAATNSWKVVAAHQVPERVREQIMPVACPACGCHETVESIQHEINSLSAKPDHPAVVAREREEAEKAAREAMKNLASFTNGGSVPTLPQTIGIGTPVRADGTRFDSTYDYYAPASINWSDSPYRTCAECGHVWRPGWRHEVEKLRADRERLRARKLHPLENLAHEAEV